MRQLAILLLLSGAFVNAADKLDPEQAKFFEMKVRPLLAEKCFKCHGGEAKPKAGLRLDTLENMLKGGQTGPAIVVGKPEESLFVKAIGYKDEDLQMPPKEKLSEGEVSVFTQWIKMGAPWPEGVKITASKKHKVITDEDRNWWSFQPVKAVAAPGVEDSGWCRNDVDRFIFSRLKNEGLAPAPEAEKVALIRRATFDLHGLPPTPEEVDAFVKDSAPDAYEKLIDRLLASPRYGERWGRHWLDLVRYAESDGFRQDAFRSHVWPYRDYVIRSFNEDKPYDKFVTEQLAGDEIAPDDPNVFVATTYLRLGQYEYNQRDVPRQWSEYLNDITDVTGDVFLGLGMGCARCHDHKFDPILQADYFRLQSFFAGLLPQNDLTLSTAAEREKFNAAHKKWEEKSAAVRKQLNDLEKPYLEKAAREAIKKFPEDMQAIINKPVAERTPYEHQLAQLAYRQVTYEEQQIDGKIKGADRDKWASLKRALAEFDDLNPKPLPPAFIATDVGSKAPPTYIPGDKQNVIEPGFIKVLEKLPINSVEIKPVETALPLSGTGSSGRRTALAKWITQAEHPLTARVIANRIWQYHFGRGIVATSSDYGHLGEKPSHPELLDYLANQFVKDGWSMKKMHRLIMTSSTYRQAANGATAVVKAARLKDPENRLLWRANTQRLDCEQVRDAMLTASGELASDAGGPSVDPTTPRRGVYTKVIRNTRDPLLDAFDSPDGFTSAAVRNVTTTPTQSLLLINGNWPMQRAEAFAKRLAAMKIADHAELVNQAFRIAFGRAPTPAERDAAISFVSRQTQQPVPAPSGENLALPQAATMPHRGGQAAQIRDGNPEDLLRLTEKINFPTEDFTIEAVVLLESIYDSAAVRVIASQWTGNQNHPGWSFGVTSEKSKHQPRNLILQIVGDPAKGGGGYEVIPSDLRLELHKTHYVAVSVKIAETGDAGITFYMRDLSDPDAPTRTASVKHKVTGQYTNKTPFIIGGREGHSWDGLIDEVRLSRVALTKEQLFLNDGSAGDAAVGHWKFEESPGFFKDSLNIQKELTRISAPVKTTTVKADSALIDFCHVLLNSNEFLYVE